MVKLDNLNESINSQFKNLIEEGKELLSVISGLDHSQTLGSSDMVKVNSWVTRSGQLVDNLSSQKSIYRARLHSLFENNDFSFIQGNSGGGVEILLGIVEGTYHDYQIGLLNNVRDLLRAEIFGDFLEMGEYLLKKDYKDAAAVIIGSVLEDALRKLAEKNRINIKRDNGDLKTIEPLNQDIYKAEVYDKLILKQITTWGNLRNSAAHGHYDDYDEKEVHMMLEFVEKFCSEFIS